MRLDQGRAEARSMSSIARRMALGSKCGSSTQAGTCERMIEGGVSSAMSVGID
jgi:hypothetical protein